MYNASSFETSNDLRTKTFSLISFPIFLNLNRFKECALTNCSVNYTPDGSYMSYNDSNPDGRSMTAYELSLSFNELEPIFDDDYENMEGAKNPNGYPLVDDLNGYNKFMQIWGFSPSNISEASLIKFSSGIFCVKNISHFFSQFSLNE